MKNSLFVVGLLVASAHVSTFCAETDNVARFAKFTKYATTAVVAASPALLFRCFPAYKAHEEYVKNITTGAGVMACAKIIEKPLVLEAFLLGKVISVLPVLELTDASVIAAVENIGSFSVGYGVGSVAVDAGNYAEQKVLQFFNATR